MKIRVNLNIEKKHFIIIVSTIFILAGIFAAYAFTQGTGGIPVSMGHSVDEIDWSKQIQGNINANGNISGAGICMETDCKTSWSQVGGTSLGQVWYIANGNPGISFTFPSAGTYLVEASGMVNTYAEYPGSAFYITYNSAQIGPTISPYHRDADSGGNSPGNWPFYVSALTGNLAAGTTATLNLANGGSTSVTNPISWKITKVA